MRPIELRIPGSFYDSQIYSGNLYLWTMEGTILAIDWNKLISHISVDHALRLSLHCALRRSEYLYAEQFSLFFQDPDIRNLLLNKFKSLANSPIDVSVELLESCTHEKLDSPFSFPHADSGFYNGNLFVGSQGGIEYGSVFNQFIESKPGKLSDIPTLGIALGSGRLAIAAGEDGVHQLDISPQIATDFRQVTPRFSNWVRWMQIALFASARASQGTFVDFRTIPRKKTDDPLKPPNRVVRQILSIDEILQNETVVEHVWGAEDRICVATPRHIDVVKFNSRRKLDERFEYAGRIREENKEKGKLVSADNAVFGLVVEFDGGILVIDSTLETVWLAGEPVNWRVFPRSRYYTNHLHLIQESHISVYSFNQDYFVDQNLKVSGIEVKRKIPFNGVAPRYGLPPKTTQRVLEGESPEEFLGAYFDEPEPEK